MSISSRQFRRFASFVRGLIVVCVALASESIKIDGQTEAPHQPASSGWEEHFATAQTAQKNQDYDTAEREYRAVLALKPDFAEVHMNLGLVYQLVGRTSEAMTEFRHAIRLKPGLAGANFFLGVDYCKGGDGAKAIPHLKAAARAEPNRADILSWLATAQEMSGDIPAEIASLQKALALQPENLDSLYLLGHAYEQLGKEQVTALQNIAPASARAEQLLAESYSSGNEWPSAVLHFQNALAASPDARGVHVELGEVLLRQGKVKRAAEEFEEELKLYPYSFRAVVRLGEVKLIQDDLEGALGDWTRVLDTDAIQTARILGIQETGFGEAAFEQLPDNLRKQFPEIAKDLQARNTPAAHFALAFLAAQNGDASAVAAELPQAMVSSTNTADSSSCSEMEVSDLLKKEQYSRARPCTSRVLKPNSSADFRLLLARSLFEGGDYEAALEVLSKLAPVDGNSPEAAYWRARCYEKLATAAYLRLYKVDADSYRMHQLLGDLAAAKNEDGKAIEDYRAAIALKPSLPNLHYSLGHVLWKDLKVKEAREEFESELKINSRHPGALNELGDTYLLEHEPEKALALLTQASALEPHNPDFHRDVGTACFGLHQFEKAAAEFRIALSGDHDGSVHYKLARVYQAMGEKEKAAHEFEVSTALNQESHSKLEKQTERLDQIEKWTRE
jgi:tetratricopeptide (TPR) repeat protein